MMGQASFLEEIDCGNFFDHIDDLIDFPFDDFVEPINSEPRDDVNFALSSDAWPSHSAPLPPSAADLSAELAVPHEDIVQLEWLSKFVEDSFSEKSSQAMIGCQNAGVGTNVFSPMHQFRTTSPVSVLESSSSCSVEKPSRRSPEVAASGRCCRVRSKRPRPAAFIPRPTIQVPSNTSSSASETTPPIFTPSSASETKSLIFTSTSLCDSDSFAESRLVIKASHPPEQPKKKKIKFTVPLPSNHRATPLGQQQAIRKCMHCEITKTPQWRAGPMGPKTLCNACGVRYKSGRLFPEYRPAASPTFVATVHSNSHKKVLEMRNKSGQKVMMLTASDSPEMIPNNSSLVMEYM